MIDVRSIRALARAALDELVAHFPGAAPVQDPAPLCVVGRRPHPATDGRLCRYHLEELGRWLRDIEREATSLDPAPPMSTRYDSSGGGALASQRSPAVLDAIVYTDPRSTALGHAHVGPICRRCPTLAGHRCTCPPLPWRREDHWPSCPRRPAHASCLHILADRDEQANRHRCTDRCPPQHRVRAADPASVLNVLHGLAQRVRDERKLGHHVVQLVDRIPGVQWPGPVCPRPCTHDTCQSMAWWRLIPVPPTIRSERDLLTRQLGWIAEQPWVADMRRELAPLREQLLAANHNEDDQPLDGHCTWLVDGEECRGSLWPADPIWSTGYESTDGTRAVVCGRDDKHRYEGADLARLSVVIQQQRREETAS